MVCFLSSVLQSDHSESSANGSKKLRLDKDCQLLPPCISPIHNHKNSSTEWVWTERKVHDAVIQVFHDSVLMRLEVVDVCIVNNIIYRGWNKKVINTF